MHWYGCGPELPLGSALHETAHLRQTDEKAWRDTDWSLLVLLGIRAQSPRQALVILEWGMGVRGLGMGAFGVEGAVSGRKECGLQQPPSS